MSTSKDSDSFGNKFQELVQTFQGELKKTTQIGMKMITASQSNSELKETYEKLGLLAANSLKSGELTWENDELTNILSKIEELKNQLTNLEDEVQNIKKED